MCCDGLRGLPESIRAQPWPDVTVQTCVGLTRPLTQEIRVSLLGLPDRNTPKRSMPAAIHRRGSVLFTLSELVPMEIADINLCRQRMNLRVLATSIVGSDK